jgi:hypothetical protein
MKKKRKKNQKKGKLLFTVFINVIVITVHFMPNYLFFSSLLFLFNNLENKIGLKGG